MEIGLLQGRLSAQAGYPDIIQAAENTCAHLLFNRMPGFELKRYSWLLNNNLFRCASISINHVTSERTWGVLANLSLLSSRCVKTVLKVSASFCLPVIDMATIVMNLSHSCHQSSIKLPTNRPQTVSDQLNIKIDSNISCDF